MIVDDIKNVTVAGCGTQGSQIATQIAFKGYDVTIWVRSDASIDRGMPRLKRIKEQMLAALDDWAEDPNKYYGGLSDDPNLTPDQIRELRDLAAKRFDAIKITTDWDEAFANADVVEECIAEMADEKKAFYTELQKHIPEHTILLTDSSTMLPSTFMEYTGRPDKFMSFHFANQYWIHNLVECMRTPETSDDTFELVCDFGKAIGMVPLRLNKEQPGYIVNSLLIPWFFAALDLAAKGVADPETIDLTWQIDVESDPEQTPFRKMDNIGLPLVLQIIKNNPGSDDPNTMMGRIAAYVQGYVDAGKTGKAAGEGFYKYE